MSLGVSAWVYPVWDSLGFLDLGDYFLPRFREVFNYYLLKYFLMVFLFVFFFWDSYDLNVEAFNIFPVVSEIVLISFNSFFFSSLFHLFLPFYLLPHLSYLLPPLFYCWFPPECFWSHLLHYSREGDGTLLQYSFLENPMDGGAWWAAVHGVVKSRTQLSDFTFTFHFHALEKEMATHSRFLALRISGTVEPGGLLCMWSHRVGHD